MSQPTPHQRLTRAGLSAQFADIVLTEHAHALAEQIRTNEYIHSCCSECHEAAEACANLIAPKAQP